jgi:hypothetical protein
VAALYGLEYGPHAIEQHPGPEKGQDEDQAKPWEQKDQQPENDRSHAAQHENPPASRRLFHKLHAKAPGQEHGFGAWRLWLI